MSEDSPKTSVTLMNESDAALDGLQVCSSDRAVRIWRRVRGCTTLPWKLGLAHISCIFHSAACGATIESYARVHWNFDDRYASKLRLPVNLCPFYLGDTG